jgi:hypothetical protein
MEFHNIKEMLGEKNFSTLINFILFLFSNALGSMHWAPCITNHTCKDHKIMNTSKNRKIRIQTTINLT